MQESFASACCQILKQRRLQLELSQEEVAKRSGLARSYVCDVERGARHPSFRNLSILAAALDLRVSELVARAEDHLIEHLDVSAMRGHSFRTREEQQIFEYLHSKVQDGLIVADQEGFIFFNQAAEHLTGIGRHDTVPDVWSEVYGCFHVDGVSPFPSQDLPLAKALRGQVVDSEEVFIRNPGTPDGRLLFVTARPLKRDNSPGLGLARFREVCPK